MPTPSPACTVQDGAGAPQSTTNGTTATPTNVITMALISSAGVGPWSLALVGQDNSITPPTLTINQTNKTATFTAPAGPWALLFESTVGVNSLGKDINGVNQPTFKTRFAIFALTSGGQRLFASNETNEGNAAFGWITKLNAMVLNPVVTMLGDVTGPSNASIVGQLTGVAGVVNMPMGTKLTSTGASNVGDLITPAVGSLTFGNNTTSSTTNLYSAGAVYVHGNATWQLSSPIGYVDATTANFRDTSGTSGTTSNFYGVVALDAQSGTFPAVGVARLKNYGSKTNIISYRHAGGDGPLLQIDGANQYIYLGNETVTVGSTLFLQGYYGVNIQTVAGAFNISTLTGANAISIKNFNNNTPNITLDVGTLAGSCNLRFGEGILATIKQDIAATNVNGSSFLAIAQAAKATGGGTGGPILLSGGAGDGAGLAGGVQLLIGGSTQMIECAIVATGRRAVVLNRAAGITTTELPANTGDLVTYLGNANTSPTASPVSGSLLWSKAAEGLHYSGPSTQFVDFMLAPIMTGSANTQVNKSWQYAANLRTANATATTILTLPLATSATNGCFEILVTGRDQAAGTVTDGVSFSQLVQFKNVGGTVTAAATQATQLKANDTSMAGCTLTYTVSSTNVLVQVAGLAATTIDWVAYATALTN